MHSFQVRFNFWWLSYLLRNCLQLNVTGAQLMGSQHWPGCLAAARQQTITWGNVDQVLSCHMVSLGHIQLTHWGLVMPYGNRDLGQHWLRCWLVAWWHQAITWTNVDLLTLRSYGIHPMALSWQDLTIHTNKIRMKLEFLKSHPDLPGANELNILIWFISGKVWLTIWMNRWTSMNRTLNYSKNRWVAQALKDNGWKKSYESN